MKRREAKERHGELKRVPEPEWNWLVARVKALRKLRFDESDFNVSDDGQSMLVSMRDAGGDGTAATDVEIAGDDWLENDGGTLRHRYLTTTPTSAIWFGYNVTGTAETSTWDPSDDTNFDGDQDPDRGLQITVCTGEYLDNTGDYRMLRTLLFDACGHMIAMSGETMTEVNDVKVCG